MSKRLLSHQPLESSIEWKELKPLSTTIEVAAFMGLKEKTLREWRSKGSSLSPPFVRLGRSVYYERDALRRWYDKTVLKQFYCQ